MVADGGTWNGNRVLPETWVRESLQPHVQIDAETEYGYLWWLGSFESGGKSYRAQFMSGSGGNKVCIFPDLALVAVITSENFRRRDAHELSERLLSDYILGAVEP